VGQKLDDMQRLSAPPDAEIARIAAGQERLVSVAQIREAGLGGGALRHRVLAGRLHLVGPGVYAVGVPLLTGRAPLWLAVLARGGPRDAVVSHRSAAALWDLLPWPAGPVDITTRRRASSSPQIRAHRSRTLDWDADVTTIDGLPVTTVARTLIDLADVLDPHTLRRVVHRAAELGLLDVAALDPGPGRRRRALDAALATLITADPIVTRSRFEEAMLALIDRAGLPVPLVNVPLLGYVADFLWPDHRLVVETDGREHRGARRYEHDRERDAKMLLAGYRVVRFTWRQSTERPEYVVATLRALLATEPSRPRP
jgi:uncharacterized protein DUF559